MSYAAISPRVGSDAHASATVRAAASLLAALGLDQSSEHTRRTAERMAASYRELLTVKNFDATTFPNEEDHRGFVITRGVPFAALCAHHLLPFTGTATVGYRPGSRLLGLSKLARLVALFASRLQVQETMTEQIADWLNTTLPDHGGVGVIVTAEHLCLSIRGAQARGVSTVTTAWRGDLDADAVLRAEFRALATEGPW